MLRVILTCVQLFSAMAIIGLVLLQRGKGAEAGAGFGAGASGTVFGARGATTALSRAAASLCTGWHAGACAGLHSVSGARAEVRRGALPRSLRCCRRGEIGRHTSLRG